MASRGANLTSARWQRQLSNDLKILEFIAAGRLRADTSSGLVFGVDSERPIGRLTAKGYVRVAVGTSTRQFNFLAHRVVWIFAHGIPPLGTEIDHLSTIKTQNWLSNLESISGLENMRRAEASGLHDPNRPKGTSHGLAKLTAEDVSHIRLRPLGDAVTLAGFYGVTANNIRAIQQRKTWKHVD